MSDRDFSAIASYERMPQGDDPNEGRGAPHICVDCEWTGGSVLAVKHHYETGHAIRGKNWPTSWGNCRFQDAGPDGRRKERKSA